jgi:8-hydroxy-5-deazaflavin:NADPH oxidoreductase
MKIGIIGAGQLGATLARVLVSAGQNVRLANSRGPETIKSVAEEAGAIATYVGDAANSVQVVIVSIPQKSVSLLPKDLFAGVADEVVVIDTGNYYPGMRDAPIDAIERGMPESQWVSQQLGRPVVKAFNSIVAHSLTSKGRPETAGDMIALPVAGDNPDAKKVVIGLANDIGFDGIDAGTLEESWRQQPGTPAYCTDRGADDLRHALAAADKTRAPQLRDLALRKMSQLGASYTNDELINMIRSLH